MTHAEIIGKWPKLSDFAADLRVQYGTAKAMRRRSSIPPAYWAAVVSKAALREIKGVTLQALAEAAQQAAA